MIHSLTEELLSFAEASLILPGEPHVMTIHRWAKQGLRGKCLESVLLGNKRYTSREALIRFIEDTSIGDKSLLREPS